MAAPVLLISSDPFLGANLEAMARGRLQVARLDPSRRPLVWPGGPAAGTVVLDVTARQREVLLAWVRRHHPGPLVLLLKPGERAPDLPPDPAQVVIGRPFRLGDLVTVLEDPPVPGPDPPPAPAPDPTPALPRPDRPAGRSRPGGRRGSPWARRRAVAARVLVGLLILLVLAGAWLALGLVEARRDLLVGAAGVRVELAAAEAALADGRTKEAAARVRAARSSLQATATVADRPRSYLLVLTAPAGPGTGGAPLAARELVLDHGAATLRPRSGALLDALGQVRPAVDFRAAGPALLAAARSPGRPRPDGVVALDPLAVRAVLAATGPVEVPGHGRLDAAGAARRLGGDADPGYARAVLQATAGRLLDGRDLLAAGRALAEAGAGGHLRAYAADPALERLLAGHRLDGAPPATAP